MAEAGDRADSTPLASYARRAAPSPRAAVAKPSERLAYPGFGLVSEAGEADADIARLFAAAATNGQKLRPRGAGTGRNT